MIEGSSRTVARVIANPKDGEGFNSHPMVGGMKSRPDDHGRPTETDGAHRCSPRDRE